MPINASQTYRLLKKVAQQKLKAAGFTAKGENGCWTRPYENEYELLLVFQCSKNGWNWDGNEFTLNFELVNKMTGRCRLSSRYGDLIAEDAQQIWIELTNRVVAKVSGVEQPPLYAWEDPESREGSITPVTHVSDDPWCRFYDEEDLSAWWLELFEPRIEDMVRALLVHGGRGDLPANAVIVEMPDVGLRQGIKQAGDLKTPTIISMPRQRVPQLIALLDTMLSGQQVVLKNGEFHLLWSVGHECHNGWISGSDELGLSGRTRVHWQMGTATVEGLRQLLGEPGENIREIMERYDDQLFRSYILLELVA